MGDADVGDRGAYRIALFVDVHAAQLDALESLELGELRDAIVVKVEARQVDHVRRNIGKLGGVVTLVPLQRCFRGGFLVFVRRK